MDAARAMTLIGLGSPVTKPQPEHFHHLHLYVLKPEVRSYFWICVCLIYSELKLATEP